MGISYGQLKEYFTPILHKKKFRIADLNGLISERQKRDLQLARAFADRSNSPEHAASKFFSELKKAGSHLKEPILEEINKLKKGSDISISSREKFHRNIQIIFAENGISADWGRPSTVGIILKSSQSLGVPTYFVLGDNTESTPFTGRLKVPTDEDAGAIYLNVTGVVSKIKEILDNYFFEFPTTNPNLWLPKERLAAFDQNICWTEPSRLVGFLERNQFDVRELDPTAIFSYFVKRRLASRLIYHMMNANSPDEFFLTSLNYYLDATLSHEASHVLERRVNKNKKLEGIEYELLAYLIQGTYSHPEIAFKHLLDSMPIDIDIYMPQLAGEIKNQGNGIFFQSNKFIRNWMAKYFKAYFEQISKKPVGEVDGLLIKSLNTTDHINAEHLPFIREAICNTDYKGKHISTGT